MLEHAKSILATAIPAKRGTPPHFEHHDHTAVTVFDVKTGAVKELHTPQTALQRAHEIMHARHTDPKQYAADYDGLPPLVGQMVEDARLHLKHWPWRTDTTPAEIVVDVKAQMARDLDNLPKLPHRGEMFLVRLRASAVLAGAGLDVPPLVGWTANEKALLAKAIWMIANGQHAGAADQITAAMFPEFKAPTARVTRTTKGAKARARKAGNPVVTMEIIELPKTEPIATMTDGYRAASSGPRIIRNRLRRPVLPANLFHRRAPVEPAGTIVIDASGSMGDFSLIERVARESPQATVAYYAGMNSTIGWLWVYARDGMRAKQAVVPHSRGNVVDGPAMDWLLRQPGPHTLITDREFTGAPDSMAQRVRLANLERAGLVTVKTFEDMGVE